MTFYISYHPDRPLIDQDLAMRRTGRAYPPELVPGTFIPKRNRSNDYLLDREIQRTTTYTGIWGVNDQDRAIQESMAPSTTVAKNTSAPATWRSSRRASGC
jgi:hypothetical protein